MDLKTKNSFAVVPFCVLAYACFAMANGFPHDFSQAMTLGKMEVVLIGSVPSMAFYLLAIVLAYLLPSEWKHRLVYLRWKNALPGHRVFTKILEKDVRISRNDLEVEYGALPEDPRDQNTLWYKIYKKKQGDEVVRFSHGRWLLFRDLFSILAITTVPSSIFTFWHSGGTIGAVFTVLSLLVLSALWICAHNTGERFACNVLSR